MRVKKGSTVHISDAPICVVGGLPVFFCLVNEAAQSLPLFPLGLAARGQVWLCRAIGKHLVLHQHCTDRGLLDTLPSTCDHSHLKGVAQDLSDCASLQGAAGLKGGARLEACARHRACARFQACARLMGRARLQKGARSPVLF